MESNIIQVAVLVVIAVFLLITAVFSVLSYFNTKSKNSDNKEIYNRINMMEKNVIKDSNENFVKILNQNKDNSKDLSKELQNSLDKINDTNEKKLNEIRVANEDKLNTIERNINDKLDKSLNERLDSSFKTIGEQLQNLQVTNGKLLNMSGTISDLQKSLASVKERGIFGEKQLENILENLMTKNMYESQYMIKNDSDRKVDFAIKIPNKDDDGFIYLPIDSKFPNDKYVAIVNASSTRDENLLNQAIKELKDAILLQAKSICDKYIEPPLTTEFAIMFLPTEGLYAECLRIDGLAEECQNKYQVLLAGPTTVTAIINSFSVGFKFLQINKNSKEIAKILQAIKVQYSRFEDEIEKTKKSIDSAAKSTEQLSKRNQMITSKLKNFEEIGIEESEQILGIDSND